MRSLVGAIIGFLTLIYPIAVYFGIQYLEPRKIGFILLGLLLLRLVLVKSNKKHSQLLIFVGIAFCVLRHAQSTSFLPYYFVYYSMNLDDNHEMDGVLNTRIAQDFMANGIIDERLNKLFTGERSNIKHKSFKEQLAIQLRHPNLNYNKRKSSKLKNIKSLKS